MSADDKQKRTSIATLIGALLFLPFALSAAPGPKKLTALDYYEIHQLYAAYSWALDSGDGAARAATFTPDGSFISSLSAHKGDPPSVIAQRTTSGGPASTRHVMANIIITPTREGADGKAYALIISGQTMPGMITGTPAFYHDKLVRTANGWRFKERHVWLDQEPDSPYRGKPPARLGPLMYVR